MPKKMDKKEFTKALLQFVEEAQLQKNRVTTEYVEQYFGKLGVDDEKLEFVYSYLVSSNIHVEGRDTEVKEIKSIQKEFSEKKNPFFEMYLEDLSAVSDYNQEEEILISEAISGNGEAKERLIEGNLNYVLELVQKKIGQTALFFDYLQEGNIGLMQAISELPKRKKEQSFHEFIKKYVENALTEYEETQVGSERIKKHLVEEINRLDQAVCTLHKELEREATAKELAAYLDMEEDDVLHLLKISHNAIKAEEH